MSLSAHHIRHVEVSLPGFADINQCKNNIENTRAGAVTDFWQDAGGTGFLYQDTEWFSVFTVVDGVGVVEVRMYSSWPVD